VGPAKASVVCLHGIQSHGGWYEYSCGRLADARYTVFYLDRRGSGLNMRQRGDAPSYRRLIVDVLEFIDQVARPRPGPPVILSACSWGGKVAAAAAQWHSGKVDALALQAPGFFAKVTPSLATRLGVARSSRFKPTRNYPIPLSDPALFTATPKWRQFIADDALSLRHATARLLMQSFFLDRALRRMTNVTVPVLLQLAGQDRIIDNVKTRAFVESLASKDKQVIEYPGAHHTMEFEPDPGRFVDDLTTWMDHI
jgi:alpha-beta hydrolase superfamily lysophospholipase